MNRLERLHRSAAVCFVGMVIPLMFTVRGFIEYVQGRPFYMFALLTMCVFFCAAFLFFLHKADQYDNATRATPAERTDTQTGVALAA